MRQQPERPRDWTDRADEAYKGAVDVKVKLGLAILIIAGIYYGLGYLF